MHRAEYRPDIQGLRAVAVILVVLEHAEILLPGGFIGVDVFFVVSGFVITPIILRALVSGTFSLRRFIVKRGRRLLPAAGIVLTVTAVGSALILSPFGTQQQAAATGGTSSVGLSNIALYAISADYFSDHARLNPFLHTWSLGVEEQFFVVFPVLLMAVWKIGRHRRSFVVGAFAVALATSLCLALWMTSTTTIPGVASPRNAAFFLPVTRAWEFTVGALVALTTDRLRGRAWHAPVSACGLLIIVATALFLEPGGAWPGAATLLPTLGTAAVIAGGLQGNAVRRLLSTRPLTWLGDRSYSLYLWHWPLLVFATHLRPGERGPAVIAIGASVLLAALTTRFVERPFRSPMGTPHDRLRDGKLVVPLAMSAVAASSTAGLLVGSLTAWGNPQVASSQGQLLSRPIGYESCLSTTPVTARDLEPCTWGAEDGLPVYLLGDSNAQQYTEALIGSSASTGSRVTVATWGGCSLLDVPLVRQSETSKGSECALYADDTIRWLRTQQRGVVVLGSSGEMVLSTSDAFRDRHGKLVRDVERKAELWEAALTERIVELDDAGFEVVLVRTAPHFPGKSREWWHPVECENDIVFTDSARCAAAATERALAQRQSPVRDAEARAVARTGIATVDVWPTVCDGGSCTTHRRGTWLYRDGLHISPAFSEELSDDFAAALGAAASRDHR